MIAVDFDSCSNHLNIDYLYCSDKWRPNQWHSFSCARCWSPVWPAAGRWQLVPSHTVWWSREFGHGRQTQSFVLRWPGLPRQVTVPGTPNFLHVNRNINQNSYVELILLFPGATAGSCAPFTFALLLWHHGVAQSQQSEKLLHCKIFQFDGFNQVAIVKLKPSVTQGVEGKVHTGCFLKRHGPST